MSTTETFQLSIEAAEIYETRFVPALFGEWAPYLVDAARVEPGRSVLDVACGTGVVARTAADRMEGRGKVVGVDLSEGMLEVARRMRPDIAWQQGNATELPFPEHSFEVVLCQAALMFFEDRARAIREMARVVTPGGTVAVQIWAGLDSQPGWKPFIDVAARHAGPEAIDLLSSYWVVGDLELVGSLFEAAGLEVASTETRLGTAHFPSVDQMVRTEVEGTPLIDRISEDVYDAIRKDSEEALKSFVTEEGTAEIPIAGHIVTATPTSS